MTWTVKTIEETDYGCEERPEGKKLKVLVTLVNETGETRRILADDEDLYRRGIDEGSTWPDEYGRSKNIST